MLPLEDPCFKRTLENPCLKTLENPCLKTLENPCLKSLENPCFKRGLPDKDLKALIQLPQTAVPGLALTHFFSIPNLSRAF
jgi:hypothetical protein